MATLNQQLSRAQNLDPQKLSNLMFGFLRTIENHLADLNRDQIHEKSEDIFGDALGFYSKATERITSDEWEAGERAENEIKIAGTQYTFKDKNNFLPSIFASVSNDFITFGASDPKLDDILSNVNLLSKSFFGLADDNRKRVINEQLKPYLQSITRTTIGV